MSSVFVSIGMSLDGFMAPPGMTLDAPLDVWMPKWSAMMGWMFDQKFFRENLKFGEGGETGAENTLAENTFKRTGVSIMGKRMFEGGEKYWPEEAPFHTPVFVVTHTKREPWVRPGGTTFYFVDSFETAVRHAREVAGDRDIRIAGGASMVTQALNAGLVDEMQIALAPVVFGGGVRAFEGIDAARVKLELLESTPSRKVTHLRYRVTTAS